MNYSISITSTGGMSRPKAVKFLLLCAAACVAEDARESKIVQTAQGPVRGYNTDGVFYFYGIPYATAPTGKRRFTQPLPGPVWVNILDAVNNKIICPQNKHSTLDRYKYEMREDCLIANVYVPDTEENNLPVVVYVHGGGYQGGFGALTSPTRLVQTKKVIAVSFNYRLGAHGFLCLGTENVPGNAGLKDQVALLRWVQKNIAKFGGDPTNVTLAGYSAGSSAVDLLMLSDITNGLFNKVIPESGANVAGWSVQLDPVQEAKNYAVKLNFTNVDDIDSLEQFYSSLPYDILMSDTFFDRTNSTFGFTPCVERNVGVEMVLSDTPVNILTKGKYRKVPMLYGFTNMEGFLRIPMFEVWKDKINDTFYEFLPADLQFKNDEEKEGIADLVKKFYFGDKTLSEEIVQGYIDFFSDVIFTFPHLRSLNLHVKAGSDSIYLYEYSFFKPRPDNASVPEYLKNIKGADHCAQSFTVQDVDAILSPQGPDSEEYKRLKESMVEIWVNFITTGKPILQGSRFPTWPPAGANGSPYMELGAEIKLHESPLLEKRARLWNSIYDRFYRHPVAPSSHNVRTEV